MRTRKLTYRDIARTVGISTSTVSKALNPGSNSYRISDETLSRIHAAAKSLGYSVGNRPVGNLRRLIGLVAWQWFPHPLGCYADVPGAISLELGKADMDMVTVLENEGLQQWKEQRRDEQLDGAILMEHVTPDLRELLAKSNIPFALFNWASELHIDQVHPDDDAGMRLAADHLLQLGHRNILYVLPLVGRHQPSLEARKRILGEEITAFGGRFSVAIGISDAIHTLRTDRTITGVLLYHEQEAPGIIEGLQEQGLRIPKDISILSCGHALALDWVRPRVTCLSPPWAGMARRAAQMLVERLHDPTIPTRREVFEIPLVVQQSTGPVSVRS